MTGIVRNATDHRTEEGHTVGRLKHDDRRTDTRAGAGQGGRDFLAQLVVVLRVIGRVRERRVEAGLL
jgi:hypothetical protein